MRLKIVHYFLLFCYLNIIAYHPKESISTDHEHVILNGESILEFIIEDFLSIPIDDHAQDVELFYDHYLGYKSNIGLSLLFVMSLAFVFCFKLLLGTTKNHRYFSKIWKIVLDYHTHLHRLQVF